MKFRPCIDLHEGRVKQIVGGTLTGSGAVENFVSDRDAAYYAELYKNDGLTGGHVIMLGPGNEDEALNALRAYPGGLQVGGGINPVNASGYLDAGASHVIITSYVFTGGKINFRNLEMISKTVGKNRLVLDLSCRRRDYLYYVVTDRWQKWTDFTVNYANMQLLEKYCNELLVHAADVEGKRNGVDEYLIEVLAESVNIPVTYAGGVRDMSDIEKVCSLGRGVIDLTIGSALDIFGGDIPYKEVINRPEFKKQR